MSTSGRPTRAAFTTKSSSTNRGYVWHSPIFFRYTTTGLETWWILIGPFKLFYPLQVVWVAQQHERRRYKRDFASRSSISNFALGKGSEFPDPFYREQWYLVSRHLNHHNYNFFFKFSWRLFCVCVCVGFPRTGCHQGRPTLGMHTNHSGMSSCSCVLCLFMDAMKCRKVHPLPILSLRNVQCLQRAGNTQAHGGRRFPIAIGFLGSSNFYSRRRSFNQIEHLRTGWGETAPGNYTDRVRESWSGRNVFLFIQAEGHIIECLHDTKMVFKVLEAEHLQGRQIEQKLDSILFCLVDYRYFIIGQNHLSVLFVLYLKFPPFSSIYSMVEARKDSTWTSYPPGAKVIQAKELSFPSWMTAFKPITLIWPRTM